MERTIVDDFLVDLLQEFNYEEIREYARHHDVTIADAVSAVEAILKIHLKAYELKEAVKLLDAIARKYDKYYTFDYKQYVEELQREIGNDMYVTGLLQQLGGNMNMTQVVATIKNYINRYIPFGKVYNNIVEKVDALNKKYGYVKTMNKQRKVPIHVVDEYTTDKLSTIMQQRDHGEDVIDQVVTELRERVATRSKSRKHVMTVVLDVLRQRVGYGEALAVVNILSGKRQGNLITTVREILEEMGVGPDIRRKIFDGTSHMEHEKDIQVILKRVQLILSLYNKDVWADSLMDVLKKWLTEEGVIEQDLSIALLPESLQSVVTKAAAMCKIDFLPVCASIVRAKELPLEERKELLLTKMEALMIERGFSAAAAHNNINALRRNIDPNLRVTKGDNITMTTYQPVDPIGMRGAWVNGEQKIIYFYAINEKDDIVYMIFVGRNQTQIKEYMEIAYGQEVTVQEPTENEGVTREVKKLLYEVIPYTFSPHKMYGQWVLRIESKYLIEGDSKKGEAFTKGIESNTKLYLDSMYEDAAYGYLYGRALEPHTTRETLPIQQQIHTKILYYYARLVEQGYEPNIQEFIDRTVEQRPEEKISGPYRTLTWKDISFAMTRGGREKYALDTLIKQMLFRYSNGMKLIQTRYMLHGENEGIIASLGADVLGKKGREVVINVDRVTSSFMDGYDKYSAVNTVSKISLVFVDPSKMPFNEMYTDAIANIGDGISIPVPNHPDYWLIDPKSTLTKCIHNDVLAFHLLREGVLEEYITDKRKWNREVERNKKLYSLPSRVRACAEFYGAPCRLVDPDWVMGHSINKCTWKPMDTKEVMHLYVENGHCRLLVHERYLTPTLIEYFRKMQNTKLTTGVIHKQKPNVDKSTHIVMDIESWRERKEDERYHRPRVVCWTDGKDMCSVRGKDCVEAFVADLSQQKGHYTVWAHNGGRYDYHLIFKMILRYGVGKIGVMNHNNRIISITVQLGEAYYVFKDSYKLLSKPLATLAKQFKTKHQKADINVQDMTEEEIMSDTCVNYCMNDCIVLQEVLQAAKVFFMERVDRDPLASLSISGYARHIFLSSFYEDECIYKLTKLADMYIREAYIGGTNWIALRGLVDLVKIYDMISAYIDAGRGKLPCGKPVLRITDKLIGPGFYRFRVVNTPQQKRGYPYMSMVHGDCGTINPYISNSKRVLTRASCEIEFALELGYEIEIIDGIIFPEYRPIMREFFEHIYKIKQENPEIGKHLTTSATGVFGFKRTDIMQVDIIDEEDADCVAYERDMCGADVEEMEGRHILYRQTDSSFRDCNVAISAWITAVARINHYKYMQQVWKLDGTVIGCVTDSIHTDVELETSDKCGGLKLEKIARVVYATEKIRAEDDGQSCRVIVGALPVEQSRAMFEQIVDAVESEEHIECTVNTFTTTRWKHKAKDYVIYDKELHLKVSSKYKKGKHLGHNTYGPHKVSS